MTGVAQLLSVNGSVVEASGSSAVVDTTFVSWGVLRIEVSAFTGGTDPTVSWTLSGLVGGQWVPIYALADQVVADGVTVVNLSPAASPGIVLPGAVRVDWALGGTADPDDATISYSLVGRN
jgi:hypothetical protein